MRIDGLEFPNILIKFCENKNHAQSIADGRIYMKASGYFRELRDSYRGDENEGKAPLDLAPDNKPQFGFKGDDKLPLFCATLLDAHIMKKNGTGNYQISPEFMEKVRNFGKCAVWFEAEELIEKSSQFAEKNGLEWYYGEVFYTDIFKEYTLENIDEVACFEPFFKKDNQYKWQNEWRIMFFEKHLLKHEDYYVMKLDQLETAEVMTLKELEQKEVKVTAADPVKR